MNLYMQLFLQFFHVGLFSFGGGYSTLPFLYNIAENFHWYSTKQLTDMIAVASITPGPVGVNVATFAGFTTDGILGALIATTSVILPSFIIITLISKFLDNFRSNPFVTSSIKALKAAGCALLSAVGIKLLFTSNLYLLGTLLLIIFIGTSFVKKQNPLFYLGMSAIAGFIFGYLNLIGV